MAMSGSPRTRNSKQVVTTDISSSSSSVGESTDSESDSDVEIKLDSSNAVKNISSSKIVIRPCDVCKKARPNVFQFKDQRFCSFKCYRVVAKAKTRKARMRSTSKAVKRPLSSTSPASPTTSSSTSPAAATKSKSDASSSFDWTVYLTKPDFVAAPVSCFKHVALSDCWHNINVDMKMEVVNNDVKNSGPTPSAFYWIASVVKTAGYMALLRYEGFNTDDGKDFWVNMCTDDLHAVGWCSSKGKPLIPPKTIENKYVDWKQFLVKKLTGSRTLPNDFAFKVEESMNNNIQKGMKLEVVDKNRISAVRVATVSRVIGGRLHITYEGCEEEDEGFWCHERSPLIHPVGWAQVIGHDLKATTEYAKQSLQKTLFREFEHNDATWDMFLPVLNPVTDLKFKVGMKLEAIDPLNLSTICVATVTKVLRNNYLMIGIDGMMAANGSDWFCYHASSPCIFPVGFCESNNIRLTPPRGYKGEFKWEEYLKQTKSSAAPVGLFKKDIPDHGFKEGMHLEAVDLMEPRLICVGSVTKVVGRLLCIHFDGWEVAYDQWCDCESPDLFPVGWCQVVGYRLEPPRSEATDDPLKKKKKFTIYKGQRKKKKAVVQGKKHSFQSSVPKKSKEAAGDGSSDTNPAKSSETADVVPEGEKKSGKSGEIASKPSVSGPELRRPLTETDPGKWTVADVAQFLRVNDCGAYSHIFSQEKIDGSSFLSLTKEGLMSLTGMKVGPSLKISHLIQLLKSS